MNGVEMSGLAGSQMNSSAGRQTKRSPSPASLFAHLPTCPSAHLPICLLVVLLVPGLAAARSKANPAAPVTVPQLELEGGRKLRYEGSFSSEKEVKTKHSIWGRLLDVVAGEPEFHGLIAPYSVVTDSEGPDHRDGPRRRRNSHL